MPLWNCHCIIFETFLIYQADYCCRMMELRYTVLLFPWWIWIFLLLILILAPVYLMVLNIIDQAFSAYWGMNQWTTYSNFTVLSGWWWMNRLNEISFDFRLFLLAIFCYYLHIRCRKKGRKKIFFYFLLLFLQCPKLALINAELFLF